MKHEYFPIRPLELTNKFFTNLPISYESDISTLDTIYTIINTLHKQTDEPPITIHKYIKQVMTVALDNFAVSFSSIYNDWKTNKDKYTLPYTIAVINDHIEETPDRYKDSLQPNTRRHEINQIDRPNKYQKFRNNYKNKNYPPRKYQKYRQQTR